MDEPRESEGSMNAEWYWLGACLIAVALFVRILSFPIVTSDYSGFLIHWFDALSRNGLSAFRSPFADYAPLYLYLLKLLSYIPLPSLYSIKALSVAFDAASAMLAYVFVRSFHPRASSADAFLAGAIFFAIPTALVNGALWAQSDALYSFFVLLSLFFLLGRRSLFACIAFGIAFSLKLQAVFFLPILAGALLARPRTLLHLLAVPLVFLATLVPALIGGGSFSYWGLIYLKQSGEYPWLTLSAPSVFAFLETSPFGISQTILFYGGVAAAAVVALVLFFLVRRAYLHAGPRYLILASLVSVLALPYFLPRMHERYFFLADLLSVLYAFFAPRRWYLPILIVTASLLSYIPYLSEHMASLSRFTVDLRIPALFMTCALLLSITFLLRMKSGPVSGAASTHMHPSR